MSQINPFPVLDDKNFILICTSGTPTSQHTVQIDEYLDYVSLYSYIFFFYIIIFLMGEIFLVSTQAYSSNEFLLTYMCTFSLFSYLLIRNSVTNSLNIDNKLVKIRNRKIRYDCWFLCEWRQEYYCIICTEVLVFPIVYHVMCIMFAFYVIYVIHLLNKYIPPLVKRERCS